jgi:hypothetical protein
MIECQGLCFYLLYVVRVFETFSDEIVFFHDMFMAFHKYFKIR